MPAQHQIAKLQLPPDLHEHYSVVVPKGEDTKVLTGLSQINLFVGSNNSGKSRLLRNIIATKELRFLPYGSTRNLLEARRHLRKVREFLNHPIQAGDAQFLDDLYATWNFDFYGENSGGIGAVERGLNYVTPLFTGPLDSADKVKAHRLLQVCKEYLRGAEEVPKYERIYIPTLRGLRPVASEDVYASRTASGYFEGALERCFTGLTLYRQLVDMLLGERSERREVRLFEEFLSVELFESLPVTLIPMRDSDVVHIRIGNEKELPVQLLGDGIQQLIVLTFPLFRNRNVPTLVFIEEPELFLHPGMQRSLIKAMQKFDNYQYFITTHSNHLLDLTLEFDDISIYMVRKEVKDQDADQSDVHFTVEPASTHDTRLLDLLGARVSSVFLSNCTVWVEGITDRRYLAKGLELYLDHLTSEAQAKGSHAAFRPRQDFHYSFVEYSGGNITHWSFLDDTPDPMEVTRLCARLMLIADKDDDKKIGRHTKLEKELGKNFVPLDCREVENLLTPAVLKKVLIDYGEDPAAIADFKHADYKGEYLGTFLDTVTKPKKRSGSYAEKSGTVTDKKGFCAKAIAHQKSWSDLSTSAQNLVKRVYEFIQEHNR